MVLDHESNVYIRLVKVEMRKFTEPAELFLVMFWPLNYNSQVQGQSSHIY